MKSLKHGGKKNRDLGDPILTLHHRLLQALNLGIKYYNNKGRKWLCMDIEIQRLAVRSISAFVDCISPDISDHRLVKDSVTDMLVALEGILQSRNEAVLGMATNVTVKLVDVLGNSILQYHVLELIHPLASLLSFRQPSVVVSCAIALNQILSKLTPWRLKRQNEVWKILRETNTVGQIVSGLQDFVTGNKPFEYFQEMASLLSTILWRWPSSRYPVWSNGKLLEGLGAVCVKPEPSVEVAVLQLFSALALCSTGAMKLLEIGEAPLRMMVHCMGSSQPSYVRIEAFKLAQCLARSQQGCLKMMSLCCEPIVEAIINAMGGWRSCSGKVSTDQLPLLVEACRFALITRWAGNHHTFFWKHGVHQILLDLVLNNFCKIKTSQPILSLKELLATAREGLDANCFLDLRPYIWDILGWVATHCKEDFKPDTHGDGHSLNVLIACACLVFVDSICNGRKVSHNTLSYTSNHEAASRAVLLMIYSPCKYIASQTKHVLSELPMPNGEEYSKYLLDTLKSTTSGDQFNVFDNLQIAINLMALASCSSLPKYGSVIITNEGIKILSIFIRWCCKNNIHVKRSNIARHLHHTSDETICCWVDNEDWEGGNILLFYSLWVLAGLIQYSSFVKNHQEVTSDLVVDVIELDSSEAQILINILQEICGDTFSPGSRWYAAYILSYFGFYGFPSKLGKRIGEVFNRNELADMQLILANGESLRVHSVILVVRCPSLLPPDELPRSDKTCNVFAAQQHTEKLDKTFRGEVRLSSRLDYQTLLNLLVYVYTGFLQVDNDYLKQLKMLARRCNLQSLSHMLCGKRPKWGSAIACCDYTPALGSAGYYFSDVILEAKATELMHWTCSVCSLPVPHMHVHKIILWSSCDYLRALLQSGMQESRSQIIKVPVGWGALSKLVGWFYSDELSKPSFGCLWDNTGLEQQLHELQPYIELCWLAEFWFLEDVQEGCLRVVESCLNSSRHLSIKVLPLAANFSQWKIAEVAANYVAPIYPHLRDSGDLEALDEDLIDMVRVAHVRFSQEGGCDPSD